MHAKEQKKRRSNRIFSYWCLRQKNENLDLGKLKNCHLDAWLNAFWRSCWKGGIRLFPTLPQKAGRPNEEDLESSCCPFLLSLHLYIMNDTSLMDKRLSIYRTCLCILITREKKMSSQIMIFHWTRYTSISYSHGGLGGWHPIHPSLSTMSNSSNTIEQSKVVVFRGVQHSKSKGWYIRDFLHSDVLGIEVPITEVRPLDDWLGAVKTTISSHFRLVPFHRLTSWDCCQRAKHILVGSLQNLDLECRFGAMASSGGGGRR